MVAAVTDNASQVKVLVVYNTPTMNDRASQAVPLVVFQQTIGERASQFLPLAVYNGSLSDRVSQITTLVIYSGKIDTPKLRRWGFVLDGHTFIVTRLGSYYKTLVYDLSTNTWSWWQQGDGNDLPLNVGINWVSSDNIALDHGSNVLCGDANSGNLYIMDPEFGMDENAIGEYPFTRIVTSQIPTENRTKPPMYQVYLTASLGKPAWDGASVTLSYSDDQGNTYTPSLSKIVTIGNYEQEFAWRSLGLAGSRKNMGSPGRLLQISDDGAFARIDSLDIL